MPETSSKLDRVRKLLAKAEADGVTPAEAEMLTEKAAELMARYGIDRAMLAAAKPETDQITDIWLDMDQPYAMDKVTLCCNLAGALRCSAVYFTESGWDSAGHYPMKIYRVRVFGYQSDLERLQILFTSLLLQSAHGLARSAARKPSAKRIWLAGFTETTVGRVRAAEQRAAADHEREAPAGQASMALVLADRAALVGRVLADAYPQTRKARRSFSGDRAHYEAGRAAGEHADIGTTRIAGNRAALSR